MRSSESTRSRSRNPPVRLYLLLAGEDHPKACTGRRLLHRGLAREVRRRQGIHPPPLVLDPYAPEPLASADRAAAARGGLLAVDCSWNRLAERGRFPMDLPEGPGSGRRRRLPILVATNPQHYGKVAQLNTVEALAAALYVVGRPIEAAGLLEGFPGSGEFFRVNKERLAAYAAAADPDAVRAAERRLFSGA
ncbi:MAG: ribosome biogenesis domain-containing protein [Thermoplasmata archaeon]